MYLVAVISWSHRSISCTFTTAPFIKVLQTYLLQPGQVFLTIKYIPLHTQVYVHVFKQNFYSQLHIQHCGANFRTAVCKWFHPKHWNFDPKTYNNQIMQLNQILYFIINNLVSYHICRATQCLPIYSRRGLVQYNLEFWSISGSLIVRHFI